MEILSATVATLSLFYIILSNPIRGLGKFLAPDTTAAVMLVAIFGVRPLFSDRFAGGAWYDAYKPTEQGEFVALLVGMIATASFATGAAMRRRNQSRLIGKTKFAKKKQEIIYFPAWYTLAVMAASSLAYIAVLSTTAGAGVFRQLSKGRSESLQIGGVPEIVMIFPLAGPVAVAIYLLAHRQVRIPLRHTALLLATTVASLALVSQLGNRRFIIPALLLPSVAALIRKPTRIKIWHIAVGIIGVLVLAILPMVRAAGARRPDESMLDAAWRYFQSEGILGTIRPIFTSYDTEMFDYIAIVAPRLSLEDFGLGRGTVLEFINRPVPSNWSSGTAWSDKIITSLFGGGCGDPLCPVASYPGILYFDGGFFLVAVGSVLMGYYLRRMAFIWQYSRWISTRSLIWIVIVSSFSLVAIRTNTIHAAWWAIYTALIAYALYFTARSIQVRARQPPKHIQQQSMPTEANPDNTQYTADPRLTLK